MEEINGGYLNPFGMIKGPEFFCSLVTWSLASYSLRDFNKQTGAFDTAAILFILIVAVIVWLLVLIWFTLNLCTNKIKLGRSGFLIVAIIHLFFGIVLLAASVYAIANQERHCWEYDYNLWFCAKGRTTKEAGGVGIATAFLMIIDSFVHFHWRNREVYGSR